MKRLEKQLEEEIEKLLDLAANKDEQEQDIDLDIPDEIKRRKDRLEKIKKAKEVVESRAEERYKEEKQEYDSKMERRKKQEDETGKKPRGRTPKAPISSPEDTDQYNFTDPESRIMKTANGFDQCYNGQGAVNDDMIIVAAYSNAHGNDKQEFIPAINAIPDELGEISSAVADTGYFSEKNINDCQSEGIDPIISTAREKHNTYLDSILNNQDNDASQGSTPADKMNQVLRSKKGKEIYKRRKQTVEPVFGIIKEVLGFRRFSLRGEFETDCEWSLVCLGYNLKRFFKLSMA
jgi:hypothetical protein